MFEMTVKFKSEDGSRSYSKKFLMYEELLLNSKDDDTLKPYIDETLEEWGDEEPDDVRISIKMTL